MVVVFLSLSVAVVRDFVVWQDSIRINKFYFFGLLKISFKYSKGQNIRISSYGSNFSEDADSPYFDDGGTGVGCLYALISVFFPAKTIMKEFKIELVNSHRDDKSIRIYLTKKEFDYLKGFTK